MNKIILPHARAQVEALHAYVDNILDNNSQFQPEIVASFILNAIIDYSSRIVTMDVASVNGAPVSVGRWQELAKRLEYQTKQYVGIPVTNIIKMGQ